MADELDHLGSKVGVLSFLAVEANLAGEPQRAEGWRSSSSSSGESAEGPFISSKA